MNQVESIFNANKATEDIMNDIDARYSKLPNNIVEKNISKNKRPCL